MLSAAAAYSTLLTSRRNREQKPIPYRLQLIASIAVLVGFVGLMAFMGAPHARLVAPANQTVAGDAICAMPLASLEALRNAGCKVEN